MNTKSIFLRLLNTGLKSTTLKIESKPVDIVDSLMLTVHKHLIINNP
jgi:hypothetical protein